MPNTCSCVTCNGAQVPLLRQIELLGHPLTVRNVSCSADGVNYELRAPHVQLMMTVLLTEWCPAHCPFCIAGDHSGHRRIDLGQLEKTLRALKNEDALNYIAISGGEPMTEPTLLNEVMCLIYEVFGFELMVGVNTNGVNLDRVHKLTHLRRLDRFRISRHHWDDARNQQLFGIQVPRAEQLRELIGSIPMDDLFALNCLLLRDWVGTPDTVRRHLEFVGEMGPALAAFITPAPINAFAAEQAVDFHSVFKRDDPSLLFTRGFCEAGSCRCQDGVAVTPTGKVVEFYGRSTSYGSQPYVRGLVYGVDNVLRDGFGGRVLMQPERSAAE